MLPFVSTSNHERRLQIGERDIAVLRGLFESRVMMIAHASALFFDGHLEYAKKRLRLLKAEGLIAERERRPNEPSVLRLSRDGLRLLSENGCLIGYPKAAVASRERRLSGSDLTLRHELDVLDVRAAFHLAAKKRGDVSVSRFSTWPLLHEFEARGAEGRCLVKPDGFLRLESGGRSHAFFLEVDRSTETHDTLVSRASAYLDHYRSGGFARRNGSRADEFKKHPFRVLMVFKTAERRNNVAESLLRSPMPILSLAWLATLEEVRRNPLGAIWTVPCDYRTVVDMPHYRLRDSIHTASKRSTERDSLVAARVPKRALC